MTDAKKPPARPATPAAPASTSAPRTGSSGSVPAASAARTASSASMRAMTATRAQPVSAARADVKVQDRLKSGASNVFLNALGAAKDGWEDFRASNRFFKYKAFIVAAWVLLSVASLMIARPRGAGADNDLSAKLVVTQTPGATIYMVKNDGDEPWKNVVIEVNGLYKTTARAELQSNDGITLTPKILVDPKGKVAPSSLQIRDVVVRSDEGKITLLENGEKP